MGRSRGGRRRRESEEKWEGRNLALFLSPSPPGFSPPPLTAPGCLSIVDSIAINGYRAAVQIPEEFESSSRQRIFRCSLVELGDRWKLE